MSERVIRPRLTEDEVRYIIYLIESQQEVLRNCPPDVWRKDDEEYKETHYKETQVCKWLWRKFRKVLAGEGKFAKPGLIGVLGRAYIPAVLRAKGYFKPER